MILFSALAMLPAGAVTPSATYSVTSQSGGYLYDFTFSNPVSDLTVFGLDIFAPDSAFAMSSQQAPAGWASFLVSPPNADDAYISFTGLNPSNPNAIHFSDSKGGFQFFSSTLNSSGFNYLWEGLQKHGCFYCPAFGCGTATPTNSVPEPGSLALLGGGLMTFVSWVGIRRRKLVA